MKLTFVGSWLVIGVIVALAAGCGKKSAPQTTASKALAQAHSGYFKTAFQEETQFIVETIAKDLVEQAYYAKNHKAPNDQDVMVQAADNGHSASDSPIYDCTIDIPSAQLHQTISLPLDRPVWAPENYAQILAIALPQPVRESIPPAAEDMGIIEALTDATAITLEVKNASMSRQLENDFTNPALHEQAALLLAAFTLREHSGRFYEVRSSLCRITAHLAMARFLSRGRPPGVTAQLAEAALYGLMNNQVAALKMLEAIDSKDAGVVEWVRALRAFDTCDYRPLQEIKPLSGLEHVAWFRAYGVSVDIDPVWEKLSATEKAVPDFIRIAQERDPGVAVGHELLSLAIAAELREAGMIYSLSHTSRLAEGNLATELNHFPERCFTTNASAPIRIIGWGHWAMFFQRHLGHAISQNFYFMEESWGVPEAAKEFSEQCEKNFHDLYLYPFVHRFTCTEISGYHRAVDDSLAITMESPHLMPAECWNYICYRPKFAEVYEPNPNPHINEWHLHNPPPHTAYNPAPRLDHPSLIQQPDSEARVWRLHDMAPYDETIGFYIYRDYYHKNPTPEQVQKVYAEQLDFACHPMKSMANALINDPKRYEEWMAKVAALNNRYYFTLGEYVDQRGARDRAATYYEKGYELVVDRVLAANQSGWLVDYYLSKGRTNEARKIADDAGESYSSLGLMAKARFLETTGDYPGAFSWYAKEEERYDDAGPLVAFCLRYKEKTGSIRFDKELNKRTAAIFPQGIQKAGLADFHNAPSDGVFVAEENDLVRQAGLKRGAVIVAVNGTRVHTFKQYAMARNWGQGLNLVVWQDSRFIPIVANPPERRFNADFRDYP